MMKFIKWVIRHDQDIIAVIIATGLVGGTSGKALEGDTPFATATPLEAFGAILFGVTAIVFLLCVLIFIIPVTYVTLHEWADQDEPRTIKSPSQPPDNTTVEKIREVVRK